MENITEWAINYDKTKRSKPSKAVQEDLFSRILTALQHGTNSYDECVAAFCRFDAKIIEPFYQDYYWTQLPNRWEWDKAFIRWADQKKPEYNATTRILAIFQEKCKAMLSVEEVIPELQWLSVHPHDRSVSVCKAIREQYDDSQLQKLLDLDMTEWPVGKLEIAKLYGVLFSEATLPITIQKYQAFIARNGLSQNTRNGHPQSPSGQQEQSPASEEQNDLPVNTSPSEDSVLTNPTTTESTPQTSEPLSSGEQIRTNPTTVEKPSTSVSGVGLAESLLKWAREQTDRVIDLTTKLSTANSALQQATNQNSELRAQIETLETTIAETRQDKATLEDQLKTAMESISTLEEEKAVAEDTIGRIQLMADNSARQELDGFKHSLASELSRTFKDYTELGDCSDADKADILSVLMDEIRDTLVHNGIVFEEI